MRRRKQIEDDGSVPENVEAHGTGLHRIEAYLGKFRDAEALKQQLTEYFAQFGEVNNLALISRKKVATEDLVGFGFVSFKTLEGAQTAKYQA